MQRPGGRNRCPYMDDFPPWMAADEKRVAECRGGICHCDVYRPGAIRLEIEKKHVGQYGDALRVMHRGLNGRFSF